MREDHVNYQGNPRDYPGHVIEMHPKHPNVAKRRAFDCRKSAFVTTAYKSPGNLSTYGVINGKDCVIYPYGRNIDKAIKKYKQRVAVARLSMPASAAYFIPGMRREVKPFEIILAVCEHFSLSWKKTMSKTRKREFVECRQWIMYLMYIMSDASLAEVGSWLQKDHATILYSLRLIKNRSEIDAAFNEKRKELIDLLCAKGAVLSYERFKMQWITIDCKRNG